MEDFRIISSVSPQETLKIARDLLRMRAAVGEVTDFNLHMAEPTRVFVFPTQRRFASYCEAVLRRKCDQTVGLFIPAGSSGSFILLPGDAKDGLDRVVYHELTHRFVANTNSGLPLWFNEGLAEYFSTFRTAGAETHLGVPVETHLRWLRDEQSVTLRKRLIPLRELFAITSSSPVYNEGTRSGVFYAQSWVLVHYLMTDDGRRVKLRRFLGLLDGGKPVDDAFVEAFGVSFSEFERALRSYIRGTSFQYHSYTLGKLAIPALPQPEVMPYEDVLHQFGHLLAHTSPGAAAAAERFLEQSLSLNGSNAGAHADLARLHHAAGRKAEADAAYAKAVELGSDDVNIYLLAGRSILDRGVGEAAKARPIFQRATELDPKSAAAWTGLGATYIGMVDDRKPGIAALEKALDLAPDHDEAAFYLAQLYANELRLDQARKLAGRVLARATDSAFKGQLTRLLIVIDDAESSQRALAVIDDAVTKANSGRYAEALAILEAAMPGIRHESVLKYARKLHAELMRRRSTIVP